MAPSHWRLISAHLALGFATITFSAWNVLAESVTGQGPGALLVSALRDVTSVLCLGVVSLLREQCSHLAHPNRALLAEECRVPGEILTCRRPRARRDWFLIAAVGLAGPFLAPVGSILCDTWSSGNTNAILNALTPACTGLFAALLGIDRPSWCLALALLLACAAGLVAVNSATSSLESEKPAAERVAGILAGLMAMLSQALFYVFMHPLQKPHRGRPPLDALALITHAYFFAATASVVGCAVAVATTDFGVCSWLESSGGRQLFLSLYAGAVCGALNFALITWACESVQITICALYGVMQPPVTALLALAAKGESLEKGGLISGALALASLLCATVGPSLMATRHEVSCCAPEVGAEVERT